MPNIKIIKANKDHKKAVLKLLDEFRAGIMKLYAPKKKTVSTTATKSGGPIFDKVINSPDATIFLAQHGKMFIGITTIYKIPRIQKGGYCAEIEEMFVQPNFQGKGVAMLLINEVVKWARKNKLESIRLESGNELARAHHFYEKAGFNFYGRAYKKTI